MSVATYKAVEAALSAYVTEVGASMTSWVVCAAAEPDDDKASVEYVLLSSVDAPHVLHGLYRKGAKVTE